MEKWVSITCYADGNYEVSNLGRVRSVTHIAADGHTYKGRILKKRSGARGYERVHLSSGSESKWFSIHRLVALAFVEKPEGCDIVNHIDNNPNNNIATNLEWTTYKGNMQWAAGQGRMKYHPLNLAKAQESRKIPVIAIKDGVRLYFESGAEAGRVLGIQSGHIAAACRCEYGYKTVGGYAWEYANPEKQKSLSPLKIKMTEKELREFKRNQMLGNKIMLGRNLSEETKIKIRQKNGYSIIQYTKDMTLVAEYESCNHAKIETGISHINDCAMGRRKTAGGYIWKLKKEIEI